MRLIEDKHRAKYERTIYATACSECDFYVGLVLDDGDGKYRGSVNEKFLEAMLRLIAIDNCHCTNDSRMLNRLR